MQRQPRYIQAAVARHNNAMLELASLPPAVLVLATASTTCLLIAVVRLASGPKTRALVGSANCHMCRRPTPKDKLNSWRIRGVEQRVCGRCHPYYKQRFVSQSESAATEKDSAPSTPPPLVGVPAMQEAALASQSR